VIESGHHLILRWRAHRTEQDAIEAEAALLSAFVDLTIELPPFNRRHTAA
jgi:hypothetical protein